MRSLPAEDLLANEPLGARGERSRGRGARPSIDLLLGSRRLARSCPILSWREPPTLAVVVHQLLNAPQRKPYTRVASHRLVGFGSHLCRSPPGFRHHRRHSAQLRL
mmetsp:Transcript_8386/g.34540  ORF Transcript_8386/g.34540 Transcript_8386/m.34540 type:complete len:106 (-) Transcript_8386:183-500(-)